jgi:sugar/nucleoside kinase (ribokinase family)
VGTLRQAAVYANAAAAVAVTARGAEPAIPTRAAVAGLLGDVLLVPRTG